jgi:hypothetical protein
MTREKSFCRNRWKSLTPDFPRCSQYQRTKLQLEKLGGFWTLISISSPQKAIGWKARSCEHGSCHSIETRYNRRALLYIFFVRWWINYLLLVFVLQFSRVSFRNLLADSYHVIDQHFMVSGPSIDFRTPFYCTSPIRPSGRSSSSLRPIFLLKVEWNETHWVTPWQRTQVIDWVTTITPYSSSNKGR